MIEHPDTSNGGEDERICGEILVKATGIKEAFEGLFLVNANDDAGMALVVREIQSKKIVGMNAKNFKPMVIYFLVTVQDFRQAWIVVFRSLFQMGVRTQNAFWQKIEIKLLFLAICHEKSPNEIFKFLYVYMAKQSLSIPEENLPVKGYDYHRRILVNTKQNPDIFSWLLENGAKHKYLG